MNMGLAKTGPALRTLRRALSLHAAMLTTNPSSPRPMSPLTFLKKSTAFAG